MSTQSTSKSARIRTKLKVFFFGLDFFLWNTNIGVSDVSCFYHSWHWLFGRIQWPLKAHPSPSVTAATRHSQWAGWRCATSGEVSGMLTQRAGEARVAGSFAPSVSHVFSEHCLGPGTKEGSEDSRVSRSLCHAESYALLGQSALEKNPACYTAV